MRSQMSDCLALHLIIVIQPCYPDAPVRIIQEVIVACRLMFTDMALLYRQLLKKNKYVERI